MNTNSTLTQHDLDRLADGELSPAERRELLTAIASSPDGWRRCALTFVEAQALSQEFTSLAAPAGQGVAAAPEPAAVELSAPSGSKSPLWLAIAAAVLVSFGLGIGARGLLPSSAGAGPSLAGHSPTEPSEPLLAGAPADPDVVTFWTQDEQGQRQSLRTRLVDAETMRERLGIELPASIPPEVREDFERRGLRLESRRRYAPLNIEDGRTLVVPVEDMKVAPMPVSYL